MMKKGLKPIGLILVLTMLLVLTAGCGKDEAEIITEEVVVQDTDNESFVGVWELESTDAGNATDVDLNNGEAERIVFTQEEKLFRLKYRENGELDSKEIEPYSYSDNLASCDSLKFELGDGESVQWQIDKDMLISAVWADGAQKAVLGHYAKTDLSIEDVIFEQVTVDFEPAKAGEVTYEEYNTPEFEDNKAIYEVLDTTPVWVMVGIADNPNKTVIDGEEAEFKLSDFKNTAYTVLFYRDGDMTIYGDIHGITGDERSTYKVIDTHYVDQVPDVEGAGFRFYLGKDGLLYACYYYSESFINAEVTDFLVLKPLE